MRSSILSFGRRNRVPPDHSAVEDVVPAGRARQKIITLLALAACCGGPTYSQEILGEYEEQVIHYEGGKPLRDPVALLQQELDGGSAKLKFEGEKGFLPDLLNALHVSPASQMLVFSKTSSQRVHTSPQTPRALYFNDEVSVGWTPGSDVIDLAAMDPERGTIFYTLEQRSNSPPRFARRNDCLQCHFGPKTMNVPGWLVRSVYTDATGKPLGNVEGFVGGHNSPLETRWAGWYVTGNAGSAHHLGNLFAKEVKGIQPTVEVKSADLVKLERAFNTQRYLSSGSDVVALLVLEHELRMQNLLTYANYEARYALAEWARTEEGRADALKQCSLGAAEQDSVQAESRDAISGWPRQRIALAGEALLEYMLFRNEAPLHGPVSGSPEFAAQFQATGPRTADNRSLRVFDLQTRLFKYPCSFLIYSPSFDSLPERMKEYIWQRLHQVLTGGERTGIYESMTDVERKNVLEILRETKPEFAAWLRNKR